jgi:hypothetical protein
MRFLGLMLLFEELYGTLPVIIDLAHNTFNIVVVFINLLENFRVRIAIGVEDIIFLLGVLMFSEDKVNPKMQTFTNIVAFQSCPHGNHELFCCLSPLREFYVSDIRSALLFS